MRLLCLTSIFALGMAFSVPSWADVPQTDLQVRQEKADQLAKRVNDAAKLAFSTRRKLGNLLDDLNAYSEQKEQLAPSILKEKKNLTRLSTQLTVLEEELSEEQSAIDDLLATAKEEKDDTLIENLTTLRDKTAQEARFLEQHSLKAQSLLTQAQTSLQPSQEGSAEPKKLTTPTEIPSLLKEEAEQQRIADTTPTKEAPPVKKEEKKLAASSVIPSPKKKVLKALPSSQPDTVASTSQTKDTKPQGVIPLKIAATLPKKVAFQRSVLSSKPKELSPGDVKIETEELITEDKTPKPPASVALSQETNHSAQRSSDPLPPPAETESQTPLPTLAQKEEVVHNAVHQERSDAPLKLMDAVAVSGATLPPVPPVKVAELASLNDGTDGTTSEEKPLRILGQRDDSLPKSPPLDTSPSVSLEEYQAISSEPAETLGDGSHTSAPLAVLTLDQGASAFKWYVFSAINRGLYKNPEMHFDLVEYSEDGTAASAKEVKVILVSLGLNPSQLHVKQAGADDEEPRIHIYPTR